jgi:hypothetical protein
MIVDETRCLDDSKLRAARHHHVERHEAEFSRTRTVDAASSKRQSPRIDDATPRLHLRSPSPRGLDHSCGWRLSSRRAPASPSAVPDFARRD